MTDYITGGSGFIGSHLAKRLHDVEHVNHLDITRNKCADCDKFFFLSTYGNMAHHDELGAVFKAGILDVHHVLTKVKPKLFVFMSSSSVNLPVQTPYSISKMCAEHLIRSFDVPHLITRPFSVTGVGEQKEHLIPKLIDSCLNGTRMDFVQEPVHDFIDVEDVVDGIMYLISKRFTGTFELGSGIGRTNREVLDMVQNVCGEKANVQLRKSMRPYDNEHWVCQQGIEGWFPKKTLLESITEMVEHAKSTS